MKINTKILKGLNQATSGSVSFSDAKSLFEKGIQRILNKNEYLKFVEFLKTLVGQKIIVHSFGKWGFYQPEISDKVKSINPPEGIVDWQIEFENGKKVAVQNIVYMFKDGSDITFIAIAD